MSDEEGVELGTKRGKEKKNKESLVLDAL